MFDVLLAQAGGRRPPVAFCSDTGNLADVSLDSANVSVEFTTSLCSSVC